MIYCFTHTRVWVEYHEVKQNVLLKMGEIIARQGAEIAFPTQTLFVNNNTAAGPEADPQPEGDQGPALRVV